MQRWCAACPKCQLVNPPAIPTAPLSALPLIEGPFDSVGMDLVGLLERSAQGCRFVLVLVDYATPYPKAVPLHNISAKNVARELSVILQVGIPKEILTDQVTSFMSHTMHGLYRLLGIQSIRTSVYHSHSYSLLERFNKTLLHCL